MDEANLNFRAKQATFYTDGVQVARLVDEDFDQFLPLLTTFETACEKTVEQIEQEKADEIAKIDAQIVELQAIKTELTKPIEVIIDSK